MIVHDQQATLPTSVVFLFLYHSQRIKHYVLAFSVAKPICRISFCRFHLIESERFRGFAGDRRCTDELLELLLLLRIQHVSLVSII